MDASDGRELRRRVTRGAIGVAILLGLFGAAGISEDGLSWRTLGVWCVIALVVIGGALVSFLVIEGGRGTFRKGDRN